MLKKIVPDKDDLPTSKANRELIESSLLGGGNLTLSNGTIHLDQQLSFGPLHSGGTLKGMGPATILRNSHTTVNGLNATLSLQGLGVAYMHGASVSSDGVAYILDPSIPGTGLPWNNQGSQSWILKPGNVVYAFIYDEYLTKVPPLSRKRYTISSFDPTTRHLELDSKPDPGLLMLKWMDGSPIEDAEEGSRTVKLSEVSQALQFPPGRYVFVTDGPSVANSSKGEHRRVLASDSLNGLITLDEPLIRSYTQATLARMNPPAGITVSKLTLGQPVHLDANPLTCYFAVDLKLDRIRFFVPDDPQTTEQSIAACGRLTLVDCASLGQLSLNGVHDVLIDGGVYGGIYGEEAATATIMRNITVRANPKLSAWPPNGVAWRLGCDRLRIERTRIEGFGGHHPGGGATSPLALEGRNLLLREVTIVNSVNTPGYSSSFLDSDKGVVDRLLSDLPVSIKAGKGWKVEKCAVAGWELRSGTTGVMTGCVPTPRATFGWIIKP